MNARVGHQVHLELVDIDVERTVEAQRGGQRADHLGDQTVEVGVVRALNVETATADIIDGLIVQHERDVGVLEQRMGGQGAVVRLHHRGADLRARIHAKVELALLGVVHREALEHQRAKARTGAAAHRVEHQEALQTFALIGQLADLVQSLVDQRLANGVMTTGKVVGSILFAADQLLRVEELAVLTGTHLIDHGRLQIDVERTRHVLATTGLTEEGTKRLFTAGLGLAASVHINESSVRLDAVLKAIKFPAAVSELDTALAKMDGDDFTHFDGRKEKKKEKGKLREKK
mmetsp:Transcript_9845/g.30344  ORF Transcript_9845/g.30344 Transcript_9845/m.30344 type:complete len:289 (-) Transcript_9845:97-963(-)